MEAECNPPILELTARIVAAYVGHNTLAAADVAVLIGDVHTALTRIGDPPSAPSSQLRAKVSPRKSVSADYIVCLEDGLKFKSLKRHLRTRYNLTPDEYRAKWGLPADYPMVAENYARARSELAKRIGLGVRRVR